MDGFVHILHVLALKRTRLEADLGKLTTYMARVDAEIHRLGQTIQDETDQLKNTHITDMDPVDTQAYHTWLGATRGTIKALQGKRQEAETQSEPVKQALKALLVKTDMIEARLKQSQTEAYTAYVEEQASTRLETWVATRRT